MVRTRRPLVERMTLVWHDWFATSNAGVGSQKLMLAQNRLLRRNALGRFDRPPGRDHRQPRDAALALGHGQPQGRPERELRPRADGAVHPRRGQRLHRARRPRAGARADRLDEHVDAQQGPDQLPLRPDAARPRHEDRVRQAGRLHVARLGLALRPPPEARRVLRRQALGLLRSRRRPTRRRAPASSRSTSTASR